jgi:CDP-6-deoxy-D-xylo-4-hexulose-3-dehydrase
MNQVFWIGVYPGLTNEMLDYIAQSMIQFASTTKAGLQVV